METSSFEQQLENGEFEVLKPNRGGSTRFVDGIKISSTNISLGIQFWRNLGNPERMMMLYSKKGQMLKFQADSSLDSYKVKVGKYCIHLGRNSEFEYGFYPARIIGKEIVVVGVKQR